MTLNSWLKRNFLTDAMFAAQLSELVGYEVKARTVESWRQRRAMPRYQMLAPIAQVTKGKVKPRDLMVRRLEVKPYKKAQRG